MNSAMTLQEAIIHFSSFENCKAQMMELRWPDGKVTCPQCGSEHVIYLQKARVWKCYGKHDHAKFSLKTGTIFEDSPIGLDKWLAALWLVVNCKNGVSSCECARDLGVTQKTAWFMNHRLRYALKDGGFGKFAGEVEVDETFIGGKARNMRLRSPASVSPMSTSPAKIGRRRRRSKTAEARQAQRGDKIVDAHRVGPAGVGSTLV
jgi:transposase-like protein